MDFGPRGRDQPFGASVFWAKKESHKLKVASGLFLLLAKNNETCVWGATGSLTRNQWLKFSDQFFRDTLGSAFFCVGGGGHNPMSRMANPCAQSSQGLVAHSLVSVKHDGSKIKFDTKGLQDVV